MVGGRGFVWWGGCERNCGWVMVGLDEFVIFVFVFILS
jgi:hypothetical protein